jgi:peptidoglycan/LPS O-acetylase OafA/YrhL
MIIVSFILSLVVLIIGAVVLHEIIEHAVRNGTRRALREHHRWLQAQTSGRDDSRNDG